MIRKAVVVLLLLLAGAWHVSAAENKGAAMITLDGGQRGAVQFPHQRHQAKLGDCNLCHDLFPKQPGAIARLIKEGQLKPKQVMNQRCIKCHRAEKRAGHKAGPVICSKCHHKG
jgi:nitrate reductase cytochrome c-type subunit